MHLTHNILYFVILSAISSIANISFIFKNIFSNMFAMLPMQCVALKYFCLIVGIITNSYNTLSRFLPTIPHLAKQKYRFN